MEISSLITAVYGDINKVVNMDHKAKIERGDDYPRYDDKDEKKTKFYFPYIPFDHTAFCTILKSFKEDYPQFNKFIDVGCGIGDKLLIAKKLFNYDVTGIEYSNYTYEIAKRVGDGHGFNVKNVDAFDFDFSSYNLIYMYVPIRDFELMNELHEKVLSEMKEGIFIDVGGMSVLKKKVSKENINIEGGWGRLVFIVKINNELYMYDLMARR